MSYQIALDKAWEDLLVLQPKGNLSVKLLADSYEVDLGQKKVSSLACNCPAKDFSAILILHYLGQKIKGLPQPSGEWLTFRELSGVEGYADAFRQRCIQPLVRKYGRDAQGIFSALERLPAKKVPGADAALEVELFEGVRALVKLWAQDEEFSADANIFFDASISRIFCTEDIVVLAQILALAL